MTGTDDLNEFQRPAHTVVLHIGTVNANARTNKAKQLHLRCDDGSKILSQLW